MNGNRKLPLNSTVIDAGEGAGGESHRLSYNRM